MENKTIEQMNNEMNNIPKKRGGNAGKVVALALCCSLVGGAFGAGTVTLINGFRDEGKDTVKNVKQESVMYEGQREAGALNLSYINTENELTPSEIYAKNVNSTVGIITSINTNYFGYQTTAAASGSGFILTNDGYIVTNYHVVQDANEIKVTTYDNKSYDAELVGFDESNDLAVLKIDADDLTPVVLGDSDQLNVGDSVVAIGNPLGELTFSLTSGSVSALDRNITINNSAMNLIQTDCAINSGNSGGALFNSHGEVIGITNAKYSGDSSSASIDNIGFAIPINNVRDIVTSIIENGYIEKPYIGISVYNSTYDQKGALVYSVEEDSPADKAGLEADDVITAVDGKEISGYADLCSIISSGKEGDKFTLTVERDGKTIELKVTLKVKKQSALPEKKEEKMPQNFIGQFPSDDEFRG